MAEPKYSIGEEVYVYASPSPVVIINRTWNSPGECWIYTIMIDNDWFSYVGEEALSFKQKKKNLHGHRPWMFKCPDCGKDLFDKAYLDKI